MREEDSLSVYFDSYDVSVHNYASSGTLIVFVNAVIILFLVLYPQKSVYFVLIPSVPTLS